LLPLHKISTHLINERTQLTIEIPPEIVIPYPNNTDLGVCIGGYNNFRLGDRSSIFSRRSHLKVIGLNGNIQALEISLQFRTDGSTDIAVAILAAEVTYASNKGRVLTSYFVVFLLDCGATWRNADVSYGTEFLILKFHCPL
jgi:hypothetical protein